VPLVDAEHLERRERHDAGVVDEDVDASEPPGGAVDEGLYLIAVGDVGGDGEGLPAVLFDLGRERLDPVSAAGAEHEAGTLGTEVAGGGLAEPAARAGDDDDFPFDLIAHDVG